MIDPEIFYNALKNSGIDLFTGVPDSLLANLCAYIDDKSHPGEHIMTANEGNAIALAAGYHLSSGNYAAVYMQNSGLGNAINPLTSLTDVEVYKIPMLLIIGWRGEPGVKDEPQHVKQGRITPQQLDLLDIPYWILDGAKDYAGPVGQALDRMKTSNAPVALLIRKDTFSTYKTKKKTLIASTLKREDALRQILKLSEGALVVSTTGKTSREVFELRAERKEDQQDFLTVGSMGHTSSIALGVALGNPNKTVVCLDGDGSLLMHLGSLPIIGRIHPNNFIHVLLNNGAHESVGGQPTVADSIDFEQLSKAVGYAHYYAAHDLPSLTNAWTQLREKSGPTLLEIRIATGSRDDLGRPTNSPEDNKNAFIQVARKTS